jgi:hypothetical protein
MKLTYHDLLFIYDRLVERQDDLQLKFGKLAEKQRITKLSRVQETNMLDYQRELGKINKLLPQIRDILQCMRNTDSLTLEVTQAG